MGCRDNDFFRAFILQNLDRASNGSAGIDHIVDQYAGTPFNVAHDGFRDGMIRHVNIACLMHEGQRGTAEQGSPMLSNAHTTGIRGNDGHVLGVLNAPANIIRQNWNSEEVVERTIKETLNLRSMQIDAHQAVRASGLVQIGNQTSRNRLTSLMLLILAGIRVERRNYGNRAGGGTFERINHNDLFHQPFVDGRRVRLNYESIGAAHRFLEAHIGLTVGEGIRRGRQQVMPQFSSDFFG